MSMRPNMYPGHGPMAINNGNQSSRDPLDQNQHQYQAVPRGYEVNYPQIDTHSNYNGNPHNHYGYNGMTTEMHPYHYYNAETGSAIQFYQFPEAERRATVMNPAPERMHEVNITPQYPAYNLASNLYNPLGTYPPQTPVSQVTNAGVKRVSLRPQLANYERTDTMPAATRLPPATAPAIQNQKRKRNDDVEGRPSKRPLPPHQQHAVDHGVYAYPPEYNYKAPVVVPASVPVTASVTAHTVAPVAASTISPPVASTVLPNNTPTTVPVTANGVLPTALPAARPFVDPATLPRARPLVSPATLPTARPLDSPIARPIALPAALPVAPVTIPLPTAVPATRPPVSPTALRSITSTTTAAPIAPSAIPVAVSPVDLPATSEVLCTVIPPVTPEVVYPVVRPVTSEVVCNVVPPVTSKAASTVDLVKATPEQLDRSDIQNTIALDAGEGNTNMVYLDPPNVEKKPGKPIHPYYDVSRPALCKLANNYALQISSTIKRLAKSHIEKLFLHEKHRDYDLYKNFGEPYHNSIPRFHAAPHRPKWDPWRNTALAFKVYTSPDVPAKNTTNPNWRYLVSRVARNDEEAGKIAVVIKRVLYEVPEYGIDDDLIVFIAELGTRWNIKQETQNNNNDNGSNTTAAATPTFDRMWCAIVEVLYNYPIHENLTGLDPKLVSLKERYDAAADWVEKLYGCVEKEHEASWDAYKVTNHYYYDDKFEVPYDSYMATWRARYWEGCYKQLVTSEFDSHKLGQMDS